MVNTIETSKAMFRHLSKFIYVFWLALNIMCRRNNEIIWKEDASKKDDICEKIIIISRFAFEQYILKLNVQFIYVN